MNAADSCVERSSAARRRANLAEALWMHHLRHDAGDPRWARPRPLRVVQRTRLDAAVCGAAPGRQLAEHGVGARVESMPSTSGFDRQDAAWRDLVLPPGAPRIAIEAGLPDFWRKYVGLEGAVIGIATFGESAPAGKLYEHFGITAARVAAAARERTAVARAEPVCVRETTD